ncbi:MAG: D-aminoacyl-tRNA deacylase [Acidimicrobiia bacterium]
MRAVIQRVSRAEVTVDSELVGRIGTGLVVLVGVGPDDGEADVEVLADKLVGLRIFPDDEGRMNRSVQDVGGGVLVVSQFTLYGDARRGRRPSFVGAAPPEVAEPLVAGLVARLATAGVQVATGRFGAMMEVDLVNSGPVTLILEVAGGRVLGS